MTTKRTHGPCTCGAGDRTSDGRLKYPVTAERIFMVSAAVLSVLLGGAMPGLRRH